MYQQILLAVDLNAEWSWQQALPTALKLCETFSAELEVISVIPSFGNSWVGEFFPAGYELKMLKKHEAQLDSFVTEHIPATQPTHYQTAIGKVYEQIIERADKIDADLIIMASHNPSAKTHILGSNAAQVIRHTHRSVFVVRG